ncbi:MAG: hypothetical protein LCH58_11830 [Bacteroidetes bacterium]|jgi:hypothetical protein|uniref:hypothetical protein n=1 Tax=Phnomibacter sp. TaxID=2836217 RepID=UPI002FDD8CE6|nr:hypothetical protein [Bacteroidota bacterium]
MTSNNTYKAVAIAIAKPATPGGMWAVLELLFRFATSGMFTSTTTTTTTTTR